MTTEAGEEDQWVKIIKAIDELYEIRDTYFPRNRDDKFPKMHSQYDLVLDLIKSIPIEQRIFSTHRGIDDYVTGKMFNLFPEYSEKAEFHLSTAVKLNPSYVDAWLSLGNCTWKKGDLPAAKNCFTRALNEGPNKNILCQLSMLTRKMAQGAENQAELIEESIQHAKKAITLDVDYGCSWHNLGNSYLTSFFATGAVDHNKLVHSIKAYQNALKDQRLRSNPDLYYKFATAHRYLDNFEAVIVGLGDAAIVAALWDPSHKALELIQDTIKLLDKLVNALKGHARVMKWTYYKPYLTSINPNTSYKIVRIDALKKDLNKAVAVVGTALSFITDEIVPPMYYVICESDKKCFALSLFRTQYDMIKLGDQLILTEPFCHQYNFSWIKKYKFKLIRMDDLSGLIVNGKNLFQQTGSVCPCFNACTG